MLALDGGLELGQVKQTGDPERAGEELKLLPASSSYSETRLCVIPGVWPEKREICVRSVRELWH